LVERAYTYMMKANSNTFACSTFITTQVCYAIEHFKYIKHV